MTSQTPIIPRQLLLGNPFALDPKLSLDGRRLAWLAPVDRVMNVWAAPAEAINEAKSLTRMAGRPPTWHDWSADGRYVLFLKDENGDENFHLFAVEAETGESRDLTPLPKVAVQVLLRSPDLPSRILIGLNDRDPRWHDVWSLDLASGEREIVYENKEGFGWFRFDWQGRIRLAGRNEPAKGGQQVYRMETGRPEPWRLIPFDDQFGTAILNFDRNGGRLFARSSVGRDRSALVSIDMTTERNRARRASARGRRRRDPGRAHVRDPGRQRRPSSAGMDSPRQARVPDDRHDPRGRAGLRIHAPERQRRRKALDDRGARAPKSSSLLSGRPRRGRHDANCSARGPS